ncbi:MAG: hypothetical protein ACRCSR_03470 [Bacteroidales bacterium]
MKKTYKILLLCFFLVILSSCSILKETMLLSDKAMRINEGMTTSEVVKAVGKPDLRSFNDGFEEWEFQQYSGASPIIDYMIVYFENGRVVSMESFSKQKYPAYCPPPVVAPATNSNTSITISK